MCACCRLLAGRTESVLLEGKQGSGVALYKQPVQLWLPPSSLASLAVGSPLPSLAIKVRLRLKA